jgi:Tfp pilus assembly protein PilF
VPLPNVQSPPEDPATRPAKKTRLRLLVPCSDRLPGGVLARLKQSPVDVLPVHPTLGGVSLRRSDVLLLGDGERLGDLAQALKRLNGTSTPVLVFGALDPGVDGLKVVSLEPGESSEATADAVLKAVVRLLKPLGKSRGPEVQRSGEMRAVGAAERSETAHAVPEGPTEFSPLPDIPKSAGLPIFSVGARVVAPTKTTLPLQEGFALGSDPMVSAKVSHSMMPESFSMQGSRWIVLDDHVARAHTTANCLADQGALVEVSGSQPNDVRLEALRSFDAVGVLVSDAELETLGPALGSFQRDARLRFVRVVPLRFSELYDERSSHLDEETLRRLLLPHWQVEHDLLRDLLAGRKVSIDHVGAAKLLRAGARLKGKMDFRLEGGGPTWVITLSDNQVLSIRENGQPRAASEAIGCLQRMLEIVGGTASLERNRALDEARPIDLLERLLDRCATPRSVFGQAPRTMSLAPPVKMSSPPAAPVAAIVAAPDAGYGEDVLTVPLERAELAPSHELPPLPRQVATPGSQRASAGLAAHGAWQGFLEQVWRPAMREAELAWSAVRPWVLTHKPFAVALTSAVALGMVTFAVVLVVEANDDAVAQAKPATPSEENGPPRKESPEAPARVAASPVAAIAEGEEIPSATESELEALLALPAPRPEGCERWVGTDRVARQAEQAKSAWRMARKSLMRGDAEQAEQRLCLSLHMDPRGPGALDMIRFQFMQSDVSAAQAWAQWAVGERPGDPEAKQLLADALHQQGKEPLARAVLLDSMSLSAADVAVVKSVANRYANAGYRALNGIDHPQADRLFRRATTLDPKHALATAGRAVIALATGDLQTSETLAERAAELDPQSFEAHLVMGDIHAARKNSAQARTEWLTAAALRPGSGEARQRLGL